KINLLGIAWEERHPGIPDVPTLKEQGIDVVCGTNRGIVVPKGTDEGIIQILRDALKRVAENPDFIADMDQQGVLVNYKGDDYVQYLKDSENDLREVAEKANMMEE
ncbi:MAG: tripartite tricarboxylate transporter substrate binding protein, partial [Clostridia bacterium]|nr:tripartite tricarboxylate transporter substrate binding protein [Clostridia bacterium]